MTPFGMTFYARMCGWTLARAHARSGDPVAIAEYLGRDDSLDQAITEFQRGYADQNSRTTKHLSKPCLTADSTPSTESEPPHGPSP